MRDVRVSFVIEPEFLANLVQDEVSHAIYRLTPSLIEC